MGKSLKGKECGKGICQRKDGLYSARFVDRQGQRHEKYFQTLPEARNWLADKKYADQHGNIFVPTDMTVDTWFDIGQSILWATWHQIHGETTGNGMSIIFSQ